MEIYQPIDKQYKNLKTILEQSEDLYRVISKVHTLQLPNCYIGGGSIVQTVWNYQYGLALNYGIDDIDIIYFDEDDLSENAENNVICRVQETFLDSPYKIDIKNEARVHLWYEQKFGVKIPPYRSSEHAISTWPSTATAIGVFWNGREFTVFAPYGLSDMFAGVIRPNKCLITKEIYDQKARKWNKKWPNTKIVEW